MARIIDFAAPLGQKAGPGQWNDLDMRKPLPGTFHFERLKLCNPQFRLGRIGRSLYPLIPPPVSDTHHRNGGMTFDEYGKP